MNTYLPFSILVLLLIVLFTLVDPFMYWMPSGAQMFALTLAAALLVIFAAFVMREKAEDERAIQHRMHAGRAAFLAGVSVLTIALVYQGLVHSIDPWIPLSLGAMIAAKLVARLYAERVH
jgi:Na+/H+ antiporter NhaD/arsenite permease-like protein